MCAFDYKKEYKEFYMPPKKPQLVEIPKMNFLSVRGKGDPNQPEGEYKKSIGMLYAVAYTIKMSKLTNKKIEGYFDYVVPPLEGFWWQEGFKGVDYSRKQDFQWISLIRLPDFVTEDDFRRALAETEKKKKQDFSPVKFLTFEEGLCVQCMHIGPYDDEPKTVEAMDKFAIENNCILDFSENRYHHEIYLSDVRKCKPENLKTVIRHPVKRLN